MKSIFQLFSLLTVAALLAGCDKRFEFLETLNQAPTIYFNASQSKITIKDSLKTSFKHGKDQYDFQLSFADPEKQLSAVDIDVKGGTGVFKSGGNAITSINPNAGNLPLSFVPTTSGSFTIEFTARDVFDKKGKATVTLVVFDNLPPVASLKETKIGVNSPYEYELNASASRDKDFSFGGGIQAYHYIIDGTVDFLTQNPTIKYTFANSGGHEVKLEVFDNDGAKSPMITKIVQIP